MCLSVREHISGTAEPIFTKFLCRSSVAVAWSSSGGVALYTSGFMDDVTFGRSGPYGGDARKASGVAIRGRSLMSVNALFMLCKQRQL